LSTVLFFGKALLLREWCATVDGMKLISQSEAAALKGYSRQAINKLSRRVWKFFVKDQTGDDCVDIEHSHWTLYMQGKRPRTGDGAGSVDGAKPVQKRGTEGYSGVDAVQPGKGKKAAGGNRGTGEKKIPEHLKKIKGGRYFKGALRQAILKRDNYKCVLCGASGADVVLEVDHIIEYEDGGETTYENGQTLCAACNKGKHSEKKAHSNIITQYEFAKRAGVHRNVISRAIDKNIIKCDSSGKINYDEEFKNFIKSRDSTLSDRNTMPGLDIDSGLTAFTPTSLREWKTYAEVQRISVEIQARLGELVDRSIVTTRMQELGQSIQMFVDLDARVAGRICQQLDRVGMEKEVQKIIAPEVKKIIEDFKEKCSRRL
jgi:hypothetical protein